ncbi:MAG: LysM peptidoglycan-binding domain-containing protein [Chloroflexi bacterium]|nr:LysM peptidoglycan-binding domain-containing protein [Chloroflexota bacterium]
MNRSINRILCAALIISAALAACSAPAATPTEPVSATAAASVEATRSAIVVTFEPTDSPTAAPTPAPPTLQPLPTLAPPRPNPTPDPVRHVPDHGTITSTYTVQQGDTLSAIAAATGATLDELQQMNGMSNVDMLKVGQVIHVQLPIQGQAPALKLIPDSELVNSPTAAFFNVEQFMAGHPKGYLNTYTEVVDGVEMTGTHILERVAEQYSVHPRLLLALLEYVGGWVDNPAPAGDQLKYPMGYNLTNLTSLNAQLNWAAARLNEGYYGMRLGARLWVRFHDGGRAYMGDGINAGTAGLQNYLAAINTRPVWLDVLGDGPRSFLATYKRLFGDPWQYDLGQLAPGYLKQPELTFPWPKGQTWLFTGGPHATWAAGSPWGAMDFTAWQVYGCDTLYDWVTAMTPGVIARSVNGEVVEALDPSGDERVGWSILYMHLGAPDRVPVGARVKAGDHLGHPSCEGGVTTGSHVHLARKYNGEWLNAAGAVPFVMSGWTPHEGSVEYDGSLTNGAQTRTPCECKELGTNGLSW